MLGSGVLILACIVLPVGCKEVVKRLVIGDGLGQNTFCRIYHLFFFGWPIFLRLFILTEEVFFIKVHFNFFDSGALCFTTHRPIRATKTDEHVNDEGEAAKYKAKVPMETCWSFFEAAH